MDVIVAWNLDELHPRPQLHLPILGISALENPVRSRRASCVFDNGDRFPVMSAWPFAASSTPLTTYFVAHWQPTEQGQGGAGRSEDSPAQRGVGSGSR